MLDNAYAALSVVCVCVCTTTHLLPLNNEISKILFALIHKLHICNYLMLKDVHQHSMHCCEMLWRAQRQCHLTAAYHTFYIPSSHGPSGCFYTSLLNALGEYRKNKLRLIKFEEPTIDSIFTIFIIDITTAAKRIWFIVCWCSRAINWCMTSKLQCTQHTSYTLKCSWIYIYTSMMMKHGACLLQLCVIFCLR